MKIRETFLSKVLEQKSQYFHLDKKEHGPSTIRNIFKKLQISGEICYWALFVLSESCYQVHLTLCVASTHIYVLSVPCAQPLYMHLECIKDVYTTSLVFGKICSTRKGLKRGKMPAFWAVTVYHIWIILLRNEFMIIK